MSMFDKVKNAFNSYWYGAPSVETYSPYRKREYYTAPSAPTKTFESMWKGLPKVNPRVLLSGHGMGTVDNELISSTSNSWDPRGEHESVKKLQSVVIPGQLINDRAVTAAVQRAENRDLTGDRMIQI